MDYANEELHGVAERPFSEEGSTLYRFKSCKSPVRHVQSFMRSWLLLRGFALLFGLWNPRRRWRAIFALIFLLADAFRSIRAVTYIFVCPNHRSSLDSNIWDTMFCLNETRETPASMKGVPLPFHMNETGLLVVVLSIAPLFSHLTFFWSIWMLPTKENCVSQENIRTLMKPSEWLKLNCEILFWVCALVSSVVWALIDSNRQFAPHFIGDFAYCILQCTNLTTCWIFGTVMSSLESLTARCLNDIMTSEHLDDIIKQHQQLCKMIFGTSNAFKLWFIVHWITYTTTLVIWIANLIFATKLHSQNWSNMFLYIIAVAIYIYVFIYPCYCAAALTGKCQQMLADFNLMTEEDWHATHPFRKRAQLHLFLQYANYANCGYRVGRLTFGSMSVFFSTLLALVGIGLKIF